jgi:acyl-[acyl-carrier-protein]-phospholipid O-acyltransferase/long-chain-fatty-acid--[acyl-carrier-protein] ligase
MSSTETTAEVLAENLPPAVEAVELPSLYADRSFWGLTVTQFLGAFNDNLFKQLVLLLSIIPIGLDGIAETPSGLLLLYGAPLLLAVAPAGVAPMFVLVGLQALDLSQVVDWQGRANFVFAISFVVTTGYAGYLSDRYGKRGIVVLCKVAEIVVMLAGAWAFSRYSQNQSLIPLYVVLFFMGAQSGFFGPAKYGILPEMLRPGDLPRANGLMLTTTFLAIIFGTFVAGLLLENFRDQLWIGSTTCVAIAVAGTLSSLFVRKLPAANPQLKFEVAALTVPHGMRALLRADRPLFTALMVSSMFWLLASMVPAACNSLGTIEHNVGEEATSYLLAVVSLGIAAGGMLGGVASSGKVDFRVLRLGAFGMFACLLLLSIPTWAPVAKAPPAPDAGWLAQFPSFSETRQWLGYPASLFTLIVLGVFTGMFAVPLQVFMQSRPPDDKKGQMIAVMNLANWGGILLAAVIYEGFTLVIQSFNWPRCIMFLFVALLTLPIVLFYHPKNELLTEG